MSVGATVPGAIDLAWSQSKWRHAPLSAARQLLSPAWLTLLFPFSFFFFVFNIKFLFFSTINSFYKYHTLYFHFSLTNFISLFFSPSIYFITNGLAINKFNLRKKIYNNRKLDDQK
jgi:hypothetical protein